MLIKVHACGVNPVETYIRSGTYARKPALPYTPGTDVAGVIESVGEQVTAFKVPVLGDLLPYGLLGADGVSVAPGEQHCTASARSSDAACRKGVLQSCSCGIAEVLDAE